MTHALPLFAALAAALSLTACQKAEDAAFGAKVHAYLMAHPEVLREAEAPQRKSVELKPDAPLLRINLGQTLVALDDKKKVAEGIAALRVALQQEDDNAVAWRLLAEAYDKTGDAGMARLSTAEYAYSVGDMRQAREFAIRARERLDKGTPEWRRATDIVLVSKPSQQDLKDLQREGSAGGQLH